jgi:hypothetical protein
MMSDLVPLPPMLLERFARLGVDELLRGAEIPRSRFGVEKPQGTTAELGRRSNVAVRVRNGR